MLRLIASLIVSTHSRPKAAGTPTRRFVYLKCFNTQPPEGGCFQHRHDVLERYVSTHSRPKAAGAGTTLNAEQVKVSTHSRPKAAE